MFDPRRGLLSTLLFAPVLLASCDRQPCSSSSPDEGPIVRLDVALGTCNFAPEAKISQPTRAFKHELFRLDGSASADLNGDRLTFAWAMTSKPPGSKAVLDDVTSPTPSFTPDLGGLYAIQLLVGDGELMSAPDEVVVGVRNRLPAGNAGVDTPWPLGTPIMLDGSMSTDLDGDSLTYSWSIRERPVRSVAALDDRSSARPRFTPDEPGLYVVALAVNDGEADGPEDIVRIGGGITGVPPIAEAGPDVTAVLGLLATLDGTGSIDPEGRPVTYAWRVQRDPPNSLAAATFVDATLARPQFLPAKEGTYVLELVVSDGFYESAPDTFQVITVPGTGSIRGPCVPDGCPMFSICLHDVCTPRGGCGETTQAGSDMPETHTIELGQTSGTFEFTFETFNLEDQIRVSYEGHLLLDTGCIGAAGTRTLRYSGSETSVTVVVNPNCRRGTTGTQWEFTVGCPI